MSVGRPRERARYADEWPGDYTADATAANHVEGSLTDSV